MISRRRIISRSQEVLSESNSLSHYECDENFWTSKEKLFQDHIQEILNKWEQIDDEIWAKIICMEKSRRVAKAYARAQVLSINGSDLGFDGYRIGLNGFQNPQRDSFTQDVKKYIGSGAKLKIDDSGNILIKRVGKSEIYVGSHHTDLSELTLPDNKTDCLTMSGIEFEKSIKLFDMKKFQTQVHKEMRNSYPDRRKLEVQCITCIAFVRDAHNILDHPIWVMIINIVALDLLKSKFPIPVPTPKIMTIYEHSMDQRMLQKPIYKYCDRYGTQMVCNSSKDSISSTLQSSSSSSSSSLMSSRREATKVLLENENFAPNSHRNRGFDDLYYCGLQARVPNYGRYRSSLALCANNSNLDLKKYFNSSIQLSSLPNEMPSSAEETLESLDMFGGRQSYRKKHSNHYQNSADNYITQQQNQRSFVGQWKDF